MYNNWRTNKEKIIAIDTNLRNIGTGYSETVCYEFGVDIYESLKPMIYEKERLKKIYSCNIKKWLRVK
jgi:hypothetical protein